MSQTRRSISVLVGNKDRKVIVPTASKSKLLGLDHNAICQYLGFLLLCHSAVAVVIIERLLKSSQNRQSRLEVLAAGPVVFCFQHMLGQP